MTGDYENFQMKRWPHNQKNNLEENSDAQKTSHTSTQRLQAPPVSSRILYGLVALCAGLLLAVTVLCGFITYQQVRHRDPILKSALNNLSVSVNAQAKHLSQEDPLGPLCEDTWSPFHLNCYKLYGEQKTWNEAKQHCEAQKAHLIVINSDEEQEHMKNMAKGQYVWLGLTDADGSWKWIDGTQYNGVKHFWSDGQPDDWTDPKYGEKEDCASSFGGGKWNDAHCLIPQPFLCEKEA